MVAWMSESPKGLRETLQVHTAGRIPLLSIIATMSDNSAEALILTLRGVLEAGAIPSLEVCKDGSAELASASYICSVLIGLQFASPSNCICVQTFTSQAITGISCTLQALSIA